MTSTDQRPDGAPDVRPDRASERVDGFALLHPTLRSMLWGQLLAGAALGLALVLTARSPDLSLPGLVERLRLAAVLLAIGVAGTLDDPTRPQLDSTPVSLARRQALRIGVAGTVAAGAWGLTLLAAAATPAARRSGASVGLPVTAVTVVAVALVAVTLAVAAAVTRRRGGSGVLPAAGTAVVLPAALALWTPVRGAMWPSYVTDPSDLGARTVWLAAHQRWATVAVLAVAATAWSLRDPWRPTWPRASTPDRSTPPGRSTPTALPVSPPRSRR